MQHVWFAIIVWQPTRDDYLLDLEFSDLEGCIKTKVVTGVSVHPMVLGKLSLGAPSEIPDARTRWMCNDAGWDGPKRAFCVLVVGIPRWTGRPLTRQPVPSIFFWFAQRKTLFHTGKFTCLCHLARGVRRSAANHRPLSLGDLKRDIDAHLFLTHTARQP